jgi:uncharacterized protein YyaL (SSP411 family)
MCLRTRPDFNWGPVAVRGWSNSPVADRSSRGLATARGGPSPLDFRSLMSQTPSDDSAGASPATNRLASQTSAYLRQHQHNPVDWYPWGSEALDRAREEDRPLLVSIGYSACHWCHVMERESFENPAIAALMNESFVNIKVDREERPDVDQIYMDASMRLTGHGGWPLNAVCTPDGRPFYVGTYFPPERRGDMPGFPELIEAVMRAWRSERDEIEKNAGQIAAALTARPEGRSTERFGPDTVRGAAKLIMRNADLAHGGFGQAPKFPTPTNLEFLTTALDFLDPKEAMPIAQFLTLTAREMARRGLYDQLGGGFHRYCVDGNWTIPHFEKMLYDQGQLLSFYAELARRSHEASDLDWPVRETVDFLRREMRGPGGAFYASQDADSEGVEGKFFVWTPDEIGEVLGEEADLARSFCTAYGVRAEGNFEDGTTHLIDEARNERREFEPARARLLERRNTRIAPATDRKHVAAWNGYAISGLARAASTWADGTMLEDAIAAADFVLDSMVDEGQKLQRIHNEGRSHTPGFLDDYAAMLSACLDLHRAGAGDRFLVSAVWLSDAILARFADRESGALYLTASDGERLIHRPRSEHDGATPDATGLALLGLTRMATLSDSSELDTFVELAIAEQGMLLERSPHAFPTLLRAIALRSRAMAVAVIVGDPEAPDTRTLAERARRVLRPEDAVVVVSADRTDASPTVGIAPEWLAGREAISGRATAYLCRGMVCSLPIQEPAELVADLVPQSPETQTPLTPI